MSDAARASFAWVVVILAGITPSLATSAPGGADAFTDGGERRLLNEHCPIMTEEFASPTQEVRYRGSVVRFCCRDCLEQFEDDPAPYLKNLPQLPPEVVGLAAVGPGADPGGDLSQPLMLGAAAGIAGWLMLRRLARRRGTPEPPTGHAGF